MTTLPVQDTIEFTLSADDVVVNDTVKLSATIVSLVKSEITEASLTASIQQMMSRLISTAKWQFSGMTRQNDQSGMERIAVLATTRVPEAESKGIDKRIRDVSVEGMNITNISADITPPAWMIEPAESKLRLTLLGKATAELAAINEVMGGSYRIGQITFTNQNNWNPSNNRASTAYAATMSMEGPHGGGETLGNAMKLTLIASVELRRHATAH